MDTLSDGAEMKTSTTRTEDKSNQINSNEKKEWNAPQMHEMGTDNTESGWLKYHHETPSWATLES